MTLFSPPLLTLAESIIQAAKNKKLHVATAESCTGGIVSACLTEIPGASEVFDRGFITYSNDSKMTNLNVSYKTIQDFGAVSAETALEMAIGALSASHADIAVSITGIAGPSGGSAEKPVGLVYIGLSHRASSDAHVTKHQLSGTRTDIRLKTAELALTLLKKEIDAL